MALRGAVFLGFLGGAALAAAAPDGAPEDHDGHGRIVVSKQDCRFLVGYSEQGAADFKPGVDVHGRPVVGANLGEAAPQVVPDKIHFTLTVRLADFVPDIADSLSDSTAPIGDITVQGREVLFNGAPLTDGQTNAIAAACRELLATEGAE